MNTRTRHVATALSLTLSLATGSAIASAGAAKDPRAGLWVVPKAQVDAVNARARTLSVRLGFKAPDPFYYDGGAVTLRILTDVLCAGAPEDEIYRLVAKWMRDDLYYQLPRCDHSSAAWELLAHFRDGHFEVEQTTEAAKLGTIIWRFERTPVEQAPESARTLVRDRGLWQRPAQGPPA